ncbi:MAG: HXXEE domain-containing protein [Anaerovoracaceae bacterium]|jgi:hypothetical protein
MKKLTNNWYSISAYLAGFVGMIMAMGEWDIRQRMVLGSCIFLFLHFYEEFAFPGGFPNMGVRVELKITDPDPVNWPLNQLNSMVGNWWFAVVLYFGALLLPGVKFLTLSVAVFGILEAVMHTTYFNISIKKRYNPGMLTADLGLLPISIWYLVQYAGIYRWSDLGLALVWIFGNYWFVFRSPFYQWMGKKKKYAFTEAEAARGMQYMQSD